MLGGHLDSWHAATGATDNAIGCAVMMEAARILKAIGVKPRRTIRVALWGGEEQGLLGSKAYVQRAFRHVREPEAGVREVRRLLQRRLRHRPHPRRQRVRPARGGDDPARGLRAVRGPRHHGRLGDDQPALRRNRQHVVQRGGPAGNRPEPGSHRIRHLHLAHEPRHVRADHRRRRQEIGGGHSRRRLSPGHARRDAAALQQGQDAAAARNAARSGSSQ